LTVTIHADIIVAASTGRGKSLSDRSFFCAAVPWMAAGSE